MTTSCKFASAQFAKFGEFKIMMILEKYYWLPYTLKLLDIGNILALR